MADNVDTNIISNDVASEVSMDMGSDTSELSLYDRYETILNGNNPNESVLGFDGIVPNYYLLAEYLGADESDVARIFEAEGVEKQETIGLKSVIANQGGAYSFCNISVPDEYFYSEEIASQYSRSGDTDSFNDEDKQPISEDETSGRLMSYRLDDFLHFGAFNDDAIRQSLGEDVTDDQIKQLRKAYKSGKIDDLPAGLTLELPGGAGTVTTEKVTSFGGSHIGYRYHGKLAQTDAGSLYNPSETEFALKFLDPNDHSVTSSDVIPYFHYCGSKTGNDRDVLGLFNGTGESIRFDFDGQVRLGESLDCDINPWSSGDAICPMLGLKSYDYYFENTNIMYVPYIPDGGESAHCMFLNCDNLVGNSVLSSYVNRDNGVLQTLLGGEADPYGLHIPDSYQDLSMMFMECENYDAPLGKAPSNVIDARYMCYNCSKQTHYMDCSMAPYLIQTMQRGQYTGCSATLRDALVDYEEDTSGNIIVKGVLTTGAQSVLAKPDSDLRQDMGSDFWELGYSKDTVILASILASRKTWQDMYDGRAPTGISEVTGGLMQGAVAHDAYGNTSLDTGNERKDEEPVSDTLFGSLGINLPSSLGGWLQRGAIDLGTYGIINFGLSKLTGSSLVGKIGGIVGTVALRLSGAVGGSFGPLVRTVAGLFPADSDARKNLESFADQCDESAGTNTKSGSENKVSAEDRASYERYISSHFDESIGSGFDVAVNLGYPLGDFMYNNGREMAKREVLLLSADNSEYADSGVRSAVRVSTLSLKARMDGYASANEGSLNENQTALLNVTYLNLFDGLSEYGRGMDDGIYLTYAGDVQMEAKSKAEYGKTVLLSAAYQETTDSIFAMDRAYGCVSEDVWQKVLEADSQYHFLTDDQWNYVNDVCRDTVFENGRSIDDYYDDHLLSKQLGGTDESDRLYGDAYLLDESDDSVDSVDDALQDDNDVLDDQDVDDQESSEEQKPSEERHYDPTLDPFSDEYAGPVSEDEDGWFAGFNDWATEQSGENVADPVVETVSGEAQSSFAETSASSFISRGAEAEFRLGVTGNEFDESEYDAENEHS